MSNLVQGNKALRDKDYQQAIVFYIKALVDNPELAKVITPNIAMAKQGRNVERVKNKEHQKVAVCGWELSDDAAERVYTLAKLYESFTEVEIIGSLFPDYGGHIRESIRLSSIAVHSFIVDDEGLFLEQALKLVLEHPYDVVHLSQPRITNIFFGLLYKLVWDARVLVDVVDAGSGISVDDYLEAEGNLPELKDLDGDDWTRLAFGLVDAFDGVTVSDVNLQKQYGGNVIHHTLVEGVYNPSKSQKKLLKEIFILEKKYYFLLGDLKIFAKQFRLLSSWIEPYLLGIQFNKYIFELNKQLINWSKKQDREKIDDELIKECFSLLLGRTPQEHEYNEYKIGWNKYQLLKQLLSCEEGYRHQEEQAKIAKNSSKVKVTVNKNISPSTIKLNTTKKPLVSIIIPIYGKLDYTLQCLNSIMEYQPQCGYEVIVVDDQSSDNSYRLLSKVKGILLLQNNLNSGFILSCNHGARVAKGEYLLFLNNDTKVHSGWLDELYKTFNIFSKTGLVGSKLIYPDGRLQEAGGIIWKNGSTWNFGNGQNPELPVFNYAREVDYISGASIMIPKIIFDELGGFDEQYCPAYCEDADLALKIRNQGYRVIYQPMSVVTHFEGITSGTDTSGGIKAYQVTNTKKLFQRWQGVLQTHQANGVNPDAEKDRRMRYRVLMLEHCTPTPDQDAGSVSVFNILLLLREMDFQVTFIAEDNFLFIHKYTTSLQKAGVEVLYSPYVTTVSDHLKKVGSRYDLVFLFRPYVVERNIDAIKQFAPQAKTLFYTHDIHHIREDREANVLNSTEKRIKARKTKQREFKAIRSVDSTIVVSTTEMKILQPQLPDVTLELLPLLLNIPKTNKGYADRSGIVFVGGYQHTPNVDAVKFFVAEVFPLIRQLLPGVVFYVVGSKPPQEILNLGCDDIVIKGFVQELNPLLDQMRVSVAPLRYGAGVKGKVGVALSCGLPSVVTTIASEGMGLIDGKQLLIVENPKEMAQAVHKIYSNEVLWKQLSEQGITFAEQNFGASTSYTAMQGIISRLGFDVVDQAVYPLSLFNTHFL